MFNKLVSFGKRCLLGLGLALGVAAVPASAVAAPASLASAGLGGFGFSLLATIDTALSTTVTDMAAFWITVAAVITTVVVYGIGISFVKRLKRS